MRVPETVAHKIPEPASRVPENGAGSDEAGAGNVNMGVGLRPEAKAMEVPPNPTVSAPAPDSTDKRWSLIGVCYQDYVRLME